MKFKSLSIFLLSLSFVLITGCRGYAVYNVKQAPISTQSESYTLSDVEKAIIDAGSSLSWRMKKTIPGQIIATINVRRHMAQVEITYNKRNYTIEYKDSENLKYKGTSIHGKYNQWIRNLDKRIGSYLAKIGR